MFSVENAHFTVLLIRSLQCPLSSVAEVQGLGGTCTELEVEVCDPVTV